MNMITVKYGVEITFPDKDVLSEDELHQLLFNHPNLDECLVWVYRENNKAGESE